ncbi:cytochrome P450 [Paenibacillus aurantiacus]|uniref:Cytochrome P450 n=1 Tax=Paenibacillus aurantiacus TaxID=1936118 RepID=A0ABV5KUU5_9BACL
MYNKVISIQDITAFRSRSEEFFPLEWYKRMLADHPVYYHEATDTWNVFRYEDVKQVLSNHQIFSSEGERTAIAVGAKNKEGGIPDKINLTLKDPPESTRRRSLISAAFTPRALDNWEPRIRQIANKLVEEMKPDGPVDLVQTLAAPLPSMVMADLFGVPTDDSALFKNWVDILFQPLEKGSEQETELRKMSAAKQYYEYLYPIVVRKRSDPADDIISDLLQVDIEGERFNDDEVVRTTMLLLGAGVETTSHMMASLFYSLLYDDPQLYEQLQGDPGLVPQTVEEMLRYRFHISKRDRTVKQDTDVLGVEMKKGAVVIAWMSAANMDEQMFANPFTLDIHRGNSKKHLTFGNGPHFCLGGPLARLELNIALTAFLQRFRRIEPVAFDLEKSLVTSAPGQSLTQLPMRVMQ